MFDEGLEEDVDLNESGQEQTVEELTKSEYKKCNCVKELATAYVPFQKMCKLNPPEKALVEGTIFPELERPYHPQKHNKTCKTIL